MTIKTLAQLVQAAKKHKAVILKWHKGKIILPAAFILHWPGQVLWSLMQSGMCIHKPH